MKLSESGFFTYCLFSMEFKRAASFTGFKDFHDAI